MSNEHDPARPRHLLVVDDNIDLAQTYSELFQAFDYHVTCANSVIQAMKLVTDSGVDAVLCDLTMPQLEGDVFYTEVERLRPDLVKRFIFVTGNTGNPRYEAFLERCKPRIFYKPVGADELVQAVNSLFD